MEKQEVMDLLENIERDEEKGDTFMHHIHCAILVEELRRAFDFDLFASILAAGPDRVVVLAKESYQPMFMKGDALSTFDKWNDVTGAIPKGTSWYYEAQALIEEIAAMAFGAGIFYESEHSDAALAAKEEAEQ